MATPRDLGLPNQLIIPDNRFGSDGASLAEYSQLFGVFDMLQAGDMVADTLYIFQYRKFISPSVVGEVLPSPWLRSATVNQGKEIFPHIEHTTGIITGTGLQTRHATKVDYGKLHIAADFEMFCNACVESGVLTADDVDSFANGNKFIPSPGLCVINVDVFVKLIRQLKAVQAYYQKYSTPRSGYQSRTQGYLMERLHSYLIIKNYATILGMWYRYLIGPQVQY